jgi:hypothetical protein
MLEMTAVPAPFLDWREQLTQLRPYFNGRGGVIHVHAGLGAPVSAFAKAVRSRLETEKWPYRWSTVQIDPFNAKTHYLPDIISQIRETVGLGLTDRDMRPANVRLGSGNRAGGDINMNNIHIDFAHDEYERSAQERQRVIHLCSFLEHVLKKQRVALILIDTHKSHADKLNKFGRKLWDGALEKLTGRGLLVIDIFDPVVLEGKAYAWPPIASEIVDLPDRYDEQNRAHAFDDLVSLSIREGMYVTPEKAEVFAQTILDTSDNISDVYASLARARARQRRRPDA